MNKKITIKDIAELAGVSTATVSYVLNNVGRINEETRKRILKIVDEVGYTPNITARNLAKRKNNIIGIMISIFREKKLTVLMDNPFFAEFLASVQYRAIEYGYSTLIIDCNDINRVKKLVNSKSISGLISLGKFDNEIFKVLKKSDIPVVLIDHDYIYEDFYYIYSDDKLGAYMATEYLIKKGHKNIGLITGKISSSIIHKSRFEGYVNALNKHGISLNSNYIFETDLNYESGIVMADKVVDYIGKISAFFVISDILSMGLIKGLYRKKIYVPDDVSIISFDNIKASRFFIPELTTINQNIHIKAQTAVDIIVNKYDQKIFTIPVEIIEGESVKEFENN